jgi:ABC-type uncharacterized transport system permease subunit
VTGVSTATLERQATAPPVSIGFWTRGRRAGAAFVVLGLAAAVAFGMAAPAGSARFTLTQTGQGAHVSIPAQGGAIAFGVLCTLAGAALLAGAGRRAFTWLTGVALFCFVFSFLCWQVGGNFMPMADVLKGTLLLAVPLILGSLSGVLCERSGVINVAIEGQFLMGAFLGALIGTVTGSIWAGIIAAAVGGLIISLLLAFLAIRYLVDQVVLGVVLDLLALGLTGFLYESLLQSNQDKYNNPPAIATWTIPVLSKIPLIGPALFAENVLVYLSLALVAVVHVGLFHTRWGLRTRAVGEHPTAADTVGIRVRAVRYRNVLVAGLVAGLGGAFFTLGQHATFSKNMTNGAGFIALAALVFGRWSPVGAMFAALLFGFATKLSFFLSTIGSDIPSQFLSMLPYVATIIAVAGLVGRVRAPAADGKPYVKG